MAKIKIKRTETSGDYSSETIFESKDLDFVKPHTTKVACFL